MRLFHETLSGVFAALVIAACSSGGGKGNSSTSNLNSSHLPQCSQDADCTDVDARCVENFCVAAGCTDGIQNGTETDIDCGGSACLPCEDGKACIASTDCASKHCAEGMCAAATGPDAPPSCTNGKQDGDETDVDCGGSCNRCDAGKACRIGDDCDSGFCTDNVCEPRKQGRQDGDETDIDCGGKVSPPCDWDLSCKVNEDCVSGVCSTIGATKKCTPPSCKVQDGGKTCGLDGASDCCRSLPVTGFQKINGKTVYLDKYEITAGRMRAFVQAVMANQGGVANIKGYMEAHRPARWHDAWGAVLPSAFDAGQPEVTYQISNPTPKVYEPLRGYFYPGQDLVSGTGALWTAQNGQYSIEPSIVNTFGEPHFFEEFTGEGGSHNVNCDNTKGSYGRGTYWLPDVGKLFPQEQMDRRALNCTTSAMFAAFCAWDGGELVREEVMEYVVGGSPYTGDHTGRCDKCRVLDNCPGCRIGAAPTNSSCSRGLNITWDSGGGACSGLPGYDPGPNESTDASGRIFVPGVIADDVIQITAADEGWYDIIGNLMEIVVSSDNLFWYNGYGLGTMSVSYHRAQIKTARFKSGSVGARCMRLK